jgi:hypothetical protein
MPSGRDSFRRNRVAPFVQSYFTTSAVEALFRRVVLWGTELHVGSSGRNNLFLSCNSSEQLFPDQPVLPVCYVRG